MGAGNVAVTSEGDVLRMKFLDRASWVLVSFPNKRPCHGASSFIFTHVPQFSALLQSCFGQDPYHVIVNPFSVMTEGYKPLLLEQGVFLMGGTSRRLHHENLEGPMEILWTTWRLLGFRHYFE